MKQTILEKMVVGLFIMSSIGCMDTQYDLSKAVRSLPKEQYFDFKTNQNITLNIDYCFKTEGDYMVLFELYDQDPSQNDEEGITLIYRAATDQKGQFSSEISLPSDISEVWLSSDYLGTVSPVKLTIENQCISFNQEKYINSKLAEAKAKTRGITASNHKYLSDWTVLKTDAGIDIDWDNNGRPNNLSTDIHVPPANILYRIKETFKKGDNKNITDYHPEFFNGTMSSDVKIIKKTKVSLVFVNSGAGWYNSVGYYTYPTNETPDKDKIKKILAFPNVSPIYKVNGFGALVCGEEVQLKYWDGKQFVDEFPAGISIGWCMQGYGFVTNEKNENDKIGDIVKGLGIRYSTSILNEKQTQRAVSLRATESNQIVAIGLEDNIDFDYSDAIFYLRIEEKDAIDPTSPSLPEATTPPTNEENSITYSGALAYEDLWPTTGDYDMNDVMIKYKSTVYKMVLTNRVFKIVDEFTPYHKGGALQSGFGYQLHNLDNSQIGNITIKNPTGIINSRYMEGQKLEPGQTHPTILLFDNIQLFENDRDENLKTFVVTTEIKDAVEKDVTPPYNPFIFIESDKIRSKELHLPKYPPTDKADMSLFGKGRDVSRPQEKLYYVSGDLMPFAINLPITNLPVPQEKVRIDKSYPKFAAWAKSSGNQNKDWYKYPAKP